MCFHYIRTNNDVEGWYYKRNYRGHPEAQLYLLVSLLHKEASYTTNQVRLVSDGKLNRMQKKIYRDIVYLITYNVGDCDPPESLENLLGLEELDDLPNLYAIGIQELKCSVTAMLTDAIFDDPWTNSLTRCLHRHNYVKGNKGAVTIRMDIAGLNVCFVNCHLAAHLKNVGDRIQDFDQILDSQKFKEVDAENILEHDYVFWMGDLNFRLDDIPKVDIEEKVQKGELKSLWPHDQLKKLMKDELIFTGFKEGPLTFPPSFKFDMGTDVVKQRKPAWCDRILWFVEKDAFMGCHLDVQLLTYRSISSYKESDHRPVMAEFILKVLSDPPQLPVMFEPLDIWLQSRNQTVCYSIIEDYNVHSRDWIGLYSGHNFKDPYDYKTYVWASTNGDTVGDGSLFYQVKFDCTYFRELLGSFCLCYYSYVRDCFIGYSEIFQNDTFLSLDNCYRGRGNIFRFFYRFLYLMESKWFIVAQEVCPPHSGDLSNGSYKRNIPASNKQKDINKLDFNQKQNLKSIPLFGEKCNVSHGIFLLASIS
ncbi:hypothetical protein LSH36_41g13107 [Paralvinella palmiformis]|uniref:Inositol polyphosphate-related phosphatase domain-containing protein n=1 Tax=Paralvinella palmiformis TaxID=53620 RepID=A0AAD9NDM9_9ANNE|nr:hypothetical protein LSH36_41g13107 [Paralvinella palmiformis]